jgi:hypothetical protein
MVKVSVSLSWARVAPTPKGPFMCVELPDAAALTDPEERSAAAYADPVTVP